MQLLCIFSSEMKISLEEENNFKKGKKLEGKHLSNFSHCVSSKEACRAQFGELQSYLLNSSRK